MLLNKTFFLICTHWVSFQIKFKTKGSFVKVFFQLILILIKNWSSHHSDNDWFPIADNQFWCQTGKNTGVYGAHRVMVGPLPTQIHLRFSAECCGCQKWPTARPPFLSRALNFGCHSVLKTIWLYILFLHFLSVSFLFAVFFKIVNIYFLMYFLLFYAVILWYSFLEKEIICQNFNSIFAPTFSFKQ